VGAFEIACEVAAIGNTDLSHDVYDRQRSPFDQDQRAIHTQLAEEGSGCGAGVRTEEPRQLCD
jgi:hypothetical protein